MSTISKVLCLPGYLQSGSTFAKKASGLRKILSKQLNIELDFISPCQPIKSRYELGFPLAATEEESDKVWDTIVANENNCRWFDHRGPSDNHGLEESMEFIMKHIEKNGPYDGVIGFSQGAAMAIMVTNSLRKMLPSHPDFKIGLFVSGFCLTVPKSGETFEGIEKITNLKEYQSKVEIAPDAAKYTQLQDPDNFNTEILIVYGKNDSIVLPIRSQYVAGLYKKNVHIFAHEGAHLLPNQKAFVKPIADLFDKALTGKL
ncbi:FSH1 [Candida oxycetoniae]|uniref:FSH1 n=1 Tax=Candida oxycetoniae TaxID=497107 RepID=A0AAI9WW69_9ASCO|nr:FSH1 [Candida oxycetoniae]KAI3402856.2 FSH1 [Candida oxycetoniae]